MVYKLDESNSPYHKKKPQKKLSIADFWGENKLRAVISKLMRNTPYISNLKLPVRNLPGTVDWASMPVSYYILRSTKYRYLVVKRVGKMSSSITHDTTMRGVTKTSTYSCIDVRVRKYLCHVMNTW